MQSSSLTTRKVPLPRSAVTLAPAITAPAPELPGQGLPGTTMTVSRQYVHRTAASEVFVTRWGTDEHGGFTATAQWPQNHSLFTPRRGQQDPMLLAETIRQAGVLLAHVRFGVPLGHHFVMWNLSYDVSDRALAAAPEPTELTLRVSCDDLTWRGRQLAAFRYRAEVWRGTTRIATGGASSNCTSPAVYRRIRGDRPLVPDVPLTPAVPPALVGRDDDAHVVLTDPANGSGIDGTTADGPRGRWLLRVDTGHPLYFDHPVDHVPGMMLLEAARQAAQALLGPVPIHPVRMTSSFERYAELAVPCWIDAQAGPTDPAGRTGVTVTGRQNGVQLFSAALTTVPLG